MKRLLTLSLVAFTFAASHAVAAPVGDPGAGKPEAAMDEQMKSGKDTAVDADKAAHKGKKAGKHAGHKKSHKKGAAQ